MTQKIILTPEGVKKLEAELASLKTTTRRELADRIKSAKEYGDLSENAEYQEAKQDQGFAEGRILEIEHMLRVAEVVVKESSETVQVGTTVTIVNESREDSYEIVGATESDPLNAKISFESPLGSALMGKKVGDTIELNTPSGTTHYTIKRIR